MSKFLNEFKTFAMRGNMIDMAVGIILGGAFGKIVSSFVSDILMPPIGLLIGGIDFTNLKLLLKKGTINPQTGQVVDGVTINYGTFIQNTVDFLIIAFSIFLFVRFINRLHAKKAETPAEKPEDVQLLTQIRDLLKKEAPEQKQ